MYDKNENNNIELISSSIVPVFILRLLKENTNYLLPFQIILFAVSVTGV